MGLIVKIISSIVVGVITIVLLLLNIYYKDNEEMFRVNENDEWDIEDGEEDFEDDDDNEEDLQKEEETDSQGTYEKEKNDKKEGEEEWD